ncbi:hypothetical protein [Paenibacillus sp. ISL-20]|uniref:hypothetical protein n=1 Tax=Paenibacillus sp. ISL-20 TaxID=2819163 RepID=UPI001BEAE3DC|nr:hypothetical protein [Paenibacillus sp. ISL-20]MBT2765305.1 hypothetical protein [Paenibacillus sp. ISL-20]
MKLLWKGALSLRCFERKRRGGHISVQSSYPNEKYFFKVFREMTGYLPGEFRKSCRPD